MKSLYTLVGTKFLGAESKRTLSSLRYGHLLRLVRDLLNPADKNAVRVYFGNTHIGYVKATEAAQLAPKMDGASKSEISGRYAITPDKWPMIEVDE